YDGLLPRSAQATLQEIVETQPRGLRAGLQSELARGHHDCLQEHAVIEPGAALQVAIDRKDQAHRCIEEGVVARVLGVHLVLVRATDAERAIETPTTGTSPSKIGLAPFHRIVVVLALAYLVAAIARHCFAYDLVARGTLQHPHMPRLRVATRRRTAGDAQHALDQLARHGFAQKGTNAAAAGDGLLGGHHAGNPGGANRRTWSGTMACRRFGRQLQEPRGYAAAPEDEPVAEFSVAAAPPGNRSLAKSTVLRRPMPDRLRASHFSVSLRPAAHR